MNSDSYHYLDDQYPDSLGADVISIALIGPEMDRRRTVADALAGCQGSEVREFSSYPPSLDDVPKLLEQQYDVIIIDLDSHSEYALELVESICAIGQATVMVYSVKTDPELLVRCMRAGAREFLTLPIAQNTMAEALVRASARRPAVRAPKKAGGKLLAFLGAKGGDGVTTLACNFAVALAQESGKSTVLIDLDLPLGDVALNLGISGEYSTVNALQNSSRLDSNFLSKLLVKHSSGVFVLVAPGRFPQVESSPEAIDRLITVARQDFENVVVDMGSRFDLTGTSLFRDGSTIYLVIQASIAGLRNSNRVISQFFTGSIPKLEIVINRYELRTSGVGEDQITKALTRPAQWKIPNDYAAVRRMQNTAIPLTLEDSPISRLIRQMARSACGLPALPEKKSGFSLKILGRGHSSKISASEEAAEIAQIGLIAGPGNAGEPSGAPQRGAAATPPEKPTAPAPAAMQQASLPATTEMATERTGFAGAMQEQVADSSAFIRRKEPETRVYKGATYVKGEDGEWHLQKAEVRRTNPRTPVITWPEPASIACGTALGVAQLNATAPVAGSFFYTPAAGEVLEAGRHRLRAVFTPADEASYTTAEASTWLTVDKVTPILAWPEPASIVCGTALGVAQLNATAPVAGSFSYTPAAGEVLEAGRHRLRAVFTPADEASYTTAEASTWLTVDKVTPILAWPEPASIVYGTALGDEQLDATASVAGSFSYTPAAGEVLDAGRHRLRAVFTPADEASYTTAEASTTLTVENEAVAIRWPEPAPIAYGTALGDEQLNATASVAGTFVYAPAAGEMLETGRHRLRAVFTPADEASYTMAEASTTLTVEKATPVLAWPEPAPIVHGTSLGDEQLNATASVAGTFVYAPAAGEVLEAGRHGLLANFTPADESSYTTAEASTTLTVEKATPVLAWPEPAPIVYGTALGDEQLNATASVTGTFVYIPAAGAVLAAGWHTPSVCFRPTDAENYNQVHAAVTLMVEKATPVVTWPEPAPIAYGTALGDEQLNATASAPGAFTYTPAAGEVLRAGKHTLTATFTPADAADYALAEATVSLTVTAARPAILTWPEPAPLVHGAILGSAQLNATSPIPGVFTYAPAAGEVLTAGTHTLSVTFTPADANLPAAQASVQLRVDKATPVITWPEPASIAYGTALGAAQLNASAPIPGTFAYTPAAGEVLRAGKHRLTVTFTPADAACFSAARAEVMLRVTKATPIVTWPAPPSIAYGTALGAEQLNATSLVAGAFVYTPAAGTVLPVGKHTLSVTILPTEAAEYTTAHASVPLVVEGLPSIASLMSAAAEREADRANSRLVTFPGGKVSSSTGGLETRTYKGATYVKGGDGQWHLQKR